MILVFFFFSSRRRHTRYIGDWSSDVCSSDLGTRRLGPPSFPPSFDPKAHRRFHGIRSARIHSPEYTPLQTWRRPARSPARRASSRSRAFPRPAPRSHSQYSGLLGEAWTRHFARLFASWHQRFRRDANGGKYLQGCRSHVWRVCCYRRVSQLSPKDWPSARGTLYDL